MPFWKCYYHVIWATKSRQPLITPKLEAVIIEHVERKSRALESPVLAANAVNDHIHVVVSIAPKIAVAEWVRNIKGITGREINALFPALDTHFHWQEGYGVLTFGAKNQNFVIEYVQRQKEHHQNNQLEPYLEQIDAE
jgi:putative transposase